MGCIDPSTASSRIPNLPKVSREQGKLRRDTAQREKSWLCMVGKSISRNKTFPNGEFTRFSQKAFYLPAQFILWKDSRSHVVAETHAKGMENYLSSKNLLFFLYFPISLSLAICFPSHSLFLPTKSLSLSSSFLPMPVFGRKLRREEAGQKDGKINEEGWEDDEKTKTGIYSAKGVRLFQFTLNLFSVVDIFGREGGNAMTGGWEREDRGVKRRYPQNIQSFSLFCGREIHVIGCSIHTQSNSRSISLARSDSRQEWDNGAAVGRPIGFAGEAANKDSLIRHLRQGIETQREKEEKEIEKGFFGLKGPGSKGIVSLSSDMRKLVVRVNITVSKDGKVQSNDWFLDYLRLINNSTVDRSECSLGAQ